MESFMEHIRERTFVNYEHNEVKKIIECMNKYLTIFRDHFNETTNEYKIKCIKSCGSMEEKTRIWETSNINKNSSYEPVLEFDFLAVINLNNGNEITESSHIGYNNLYIESNECWLTESKSKLSPKTVNKAFSEKMIAIMKKKCTAFSDNFELNSYNFLSRKKDCSCSVCKVGQLSLQEITMKELNFRWTITNAENQIRNFRSPTVLIKLDFLPAFKIEKNTRPYFLVPKVCRHQHEYCWRMSFCIDEIQTFKNTSQLHRNAYKFAKALFQILDWIEIPSYDLKNVLFQHLDECQNRHHHVLPCVCKVLTKFGNYIREGKIPNYYIEKLELERAFQSKGYKAFGEFLIHLGEIFENKPRTGDEMMNVEGMSCTRWTKVINKELYETAEAIVKEETKSPNMYDTFEKELAKVKIQFEQYKSEDDSKKKKCFIT